MREDVGVADGVGGAGEDYPAFVEDIGVVDDVEHAFDVVLNDHDGCLELVADLGDLIEYLIDYVSPAHSRAPRASVRSSGLLDET